MVVVGGGRWLSCSACYCSLLVSSGGWGCWLTPPCNSCLRHSPSPMVSPVCVFLRCWSSLFHHTYIYTYLVSTVDSKMQSSLSDHDFISLSHDQVSGSHDLEQLSHDMLRQLQSQQLLPRHYCSAVLDSVTPLLPSFLGRDFLLSQPGSEGRLLLQCVSSCLQIIAACVELRQGIAKHCTPVDEQVKACFSLRCFCDQP